MENYQVLLLLSVVVLIGAFYGNTVEQRIFQIKNDFLKHEKEIKEVKVELESTKMELKLVKVELELTGNEVKQVKEGLETTRKELKQAQVELESTGNKLKLVIEELESTKKELKQVKVESDTTKEQINILRKEMIEENNARRKKISQIRTDVFMLPEELDKIKTEIQKQRPGFYATLSSTTTLGQTQRIVFDKIITDVTNNNNKITGVFTVPMNGLYHFSSTMFSYSGNLHAEIMQNHLVIGRNHGTSAYVSAAINVVISCKQGDSVFVRHMAEKSIQTIYWYGYTAFSGFLIN